MTQEKKEMIAHILLKCGFDEDSQRMLFLQLVQDENLIFDMYQKLK